MLTFQQEEIGNAWTNSGRGRANGRRDKLTNYQKIVDSLSYGSREQ